MDTPSRRSGVRHGRLAKLPCAAPSGLICAQGHHSGAFPSSHRYDGMPGPGTPLCGSRRLDGDGGSLAEWRTWAGLWAIRPYRRCDRATRAGAGPLRHRTRPCGLRRARRLGRTRPDQDLTGQLQARWPARGSAGAWLRPGERPGDSESVMRSGPVESRGMAGSIADAELARFLADMYAHPAPPAAEVGPDALRGAAEERAAARPPGPEMDAVADVVIPPGDVPARLYQQAGDRSPSLCISTEAAG